MARQNLNEFTDLVWTITEEGIKVSIIDEDNYVVNYETCDNVFVLPFEN